MLKSLKKCSDVARLAVMVALLGGCKFPPLPDLADAASPDAGDAAIGDATDASIDGATCTQTTCSAGILEVCGPSGTVESTEMCRLGCFSNDRCARVDPSNGLGSQLDTTPGLSDVTIPAGATIDTDNGIIRSGGQVIAVATETVAQTGAPNVRVFMAHSFTMGDIRVSGSLPVVLVAFGDIDLQGIIDVSADVGVAGAGAITCTGNGRGGNQPAGIWSVRRAGHDGTGQYVYTSAGGGGGGFGSAGAKGGDYDGVSTGGSGGATNGVPQLVPLRGGCAGGGVNSGGADVGHAGLGGGAIQLVSAIGEIVVAGSSPALGGVHAGGSGGRGCDNNGYGSNPPLGAGCGTGGGGSGGGILLEAASVRFDTGAVLLVAGGGGGGSGGCGEPRHGQDAPPNGATAAGGSCPVETWGTPAPGGASASASAAQVGGNNGQYFAAGSGGGGLGRIRINTVDGNYAGAGNLLSRGVLTTGTVTTR